MGKLTYSFYFLSLFIFLFDRVDCVSETRACANADCTEPLSNAKTLLSYMSPDKHVLSFNKNQDVKVLSKSSNGLWGVEINGKTGYAPAKFLRETKKLNNPSITLPAEVFDELKGSKRVPEKISKNTIEAQVVENKNLDQQGKVTEALPLKDIPNEEPIKSGVSAEKLNFDGDIQASQAFTVLDGTTILPSFIEDTTDDSQAEKKPVQNDEVLSDEDEGDHDDDDGLVSSEDGSTDDLLLESEQPDETGSSVISEINPEGLNLKSQPYLPENDSVISSPIEESIILSKLELNVQDLSALHKEPSTPETENNSLSENNKIDEILINNENVHKSEQLPMANIQENVPQEIFNHDPYKTNQNLGESSVEGLSVEINNTKTLLIDSETAVPPVEIVHSNISQEKVYNEVLEKPQSNEIKAEMYNEIDSRIDSNNLNSNILETTENLNSSVEINNEYYTTENVVTNINEMNNIAEEKSSPTTESYVESHIENNNFYLKPPILLDPSLLALRKNIANENTLNSENVNNTPLDNNTYSDENITDSQNIPENVQEHLFNSDTSTENPQIELTTVEAVHYEIPPLPEINMADLTTDALSENDVESTTPTAFGSSSIIYDYSNIPKDQFQDVSLSEQVPNKPYPDNLNMNDIPVSDSSNAPQVKNNFDDIPLLMEDVSSTNSPSVEKNVEFAVEENVLSDNSDNLQDESDTSGSIFGTVFESVYGQLSNLFKSNKNEDLLINPEASFQDKSDKSMEKIDEENNKLMDIQHSHDFISTVLSESAQPQCKPEENMITLTEVSSDLILWLVISAVSVLMFTLGYYFLENRKQDGKLLAMVNSLQKELLCTSKECILLKDELTITKEKLSGIEDSSFGSDEMVACLKKEIVDAEQTISDLQDKLTSAEEELANSTEAALELQAILDDQLSSKDTSSSSLTFTVTNLQSQLDEQQTTMNLTKAQLASKVEENELLLAKLVDTGNKSASMEKELVDCQNQLQHARNECESKSQQLKDLTSNMEKSLQEVKQQKAADIKELQQHLQINKSELETTKVVLKARAHEVTSLQENLKLLKLDDKNIDAILDISHTKSELTQAIAEKTILAEKFEKEQILLSELNNKVDQQDAKMIQMKDQLDEAEQKALQATSRLEVLTNYFNQKEAELIKELSTKEAFWLSQQGEAMSTIEKIQSLQHEIQQYKDTAESVRRELAEQEAAWRARSAALERRAHEQWLARRAAERAAEAAATEAQTLRQRLTAPSPTDKPQGMVSPLNAGDGIPELPLLPPPLGGLPPPPLPFLPPTPLSFLHPSSLPFLPPMGGVSQPFFPPPLQPQRPPPLGRLSSPPPLPPQHMQHDRYSPDSRYSPDLDYSSDTKRYRGRSPYSPQDVRRRGYTNRRYDDDRYYDSGEDRRPRRYDETETDLSPPPSPPPRRLGPRNHKGVSSGSGQSSESLERISKHSGKY